MRDLFGDDIHQPTPSPFRAASAVWAQLYRDAERREYVWRPRCNRHLSEILGALAGVDEFRAVAAAYLADKWQGYEGHELRQLWRDLNKFRAIAGRSSPAQRGRKFQDN
jgi:hypothetical protein